jgi:hypothetical protein
MLPESLTMTEFLNQLDTLELPALEALQIYAEGSRIFYEGEGKHGDQTPTAGNAGLLACLETGWSLTVFERVKPGECYDRGEHYVTASTYRFLELEGRMVYEFVLEPVREPVLEPVV